jgi:hypothetical protein
MLIVTCLLRTRLCFSGQWDIGVMRMQVAMLGKDPVLHSLVLNLQFVLPDVGSGLRKALELWSELFATP